MLLVSLIVLFASCKHISSQSWNVNDGILPWESYVQVTNIQQPLGLTLNYSSLAHHHFAIGYFCFHSFMYDEAQEAFDLAISIAPTLVEPYIGKMLGCKQALWSITDFNCGLTTYANLSTMITTNNLTLTPLQLSLVETVYQWYANQSSIAAGENAFLSSIANVSQRYQNLTDIRVLWGLSLLNVAYEEAYEGQMQPGPMIQAREILATALQSQPNHPGALNYIINAYDVAQINVAQQAIGYLSTYQNVVPSLSYPQHLPAEIWIRTGAMVSAKSSDDTSIQNSLALCLTKTLGRLTLVSSSELEPALAQLNSTTQVSSFLECDQRNRATATEWFSLTRLQTGNWNGTLSSLNDLYISQDLSIPTSNYYLAYAYRARARVIVNLFYWLPYDIQFGEKVEDVINLNETTPFVQLGNDTSDWNLAWSEAGYRLSECLRLLTINSTAYEDTTVQPIIDDHLARFAVLANQTAASNNYVSTSISMMISQIRGIIYYQNGSYQQCLDVLNQATQQEANLVIDTNSPILTFARSSELLGMHLLLIYRVYQDQLSQANPPAFILNNSQVLVSSFARLALNLYQTANLTAPNRAINILGTARAYSQLRDNAQAYRYYQLLIVQITSTNTADPIFAQEASNFIAQYVDLQNSANPKQFHFSFISVTLLYFLLFFLI